MTLSTLSVVQQTPLETKHRDNISRSTLDNSSKAQEFNIQDILVNSPSHDTQSSKKSLLSECNTHLFILELGVQNSQFHQRF